jgi:hypothetical protein
MHVNQDFILMRVEKNLPELIDVCQARGPLFGKGYNDQVTAVSRYAKCLQKALEALRQADAAQSKGIT